MVDPPVMVYKCPNDTWMMIHSFLLAYHVQPVFRGVVIHKGHNMITRRFVFVCICVCVFVCVCVVTLLLLFFTADGFAAPPFFVVEILKPA